MSTSPSLTQTPLNEFWHAGGFIVSEAGGHRSRDAATIGGATIVYPGTARMRRDYCVNALAVSPTNPQSSPPLIEARRALSPVA